MKLINKVGSSDESRIRQPLIRSIAAVFVLAVLATLPTLPYAVHGAVAPDQSSFAFSLSNSGNIAVVQGGEGSNTITVTLVQGAPQLVTLSCNNLPARATCGLNPVQAAPTFTSTLTIATAFTTPVGAVTITVIGSGGGQTSSTQFTLDVKPAGSVGGISLPATTSGQLAPFAGIGLALLAIIGAAIYGIRSRAKAHRSSTNLNQL